MAKLLVVFCFSCLAEITRFSLNYSFSLHAVCMHMLSSVWGGYVWIHACVIMFSDSSFPVAAAFPAALMGLLSGACVAWPTPPTECRTLCRCRPDESRSQKASSQPAQEGPAVVLQAASWRVHVARSPGLPANSWQQLTSP